MDRESPDPESLLLGEEEEEEELSEKQLLQPPPPALKRTRRDRRQIQTWLHGAALVFYLALTIVLYTWSVRLRATQKSACACEAGQISSPAQEAVEYERVTITHNLEDSESKYRGEPSPEIDAAWDELLKYNNLRVSDEELRAANASSVPLSDGGGGHLATLDVYHTLHCVNRARKALYPAHYPSPNRPELDRAHVEHCLDLLRQVLMCHGDVALHTYRWRGDVPVPWPAFRTTHQCRRWDRIVAWSRARSVPSLEGPALRHPTLGESYPAAHGGGNAARMTERDGTGG
ncbi:hypothetical protein V2A60_010365 [Cordyceps javanica]